MLKGCSYTVTSNPPADQFVLVYDLFTEEKDHRPQSPSFAHALRKTLDDNPSAEVLGFGLEFDYTWQADEDPQIYTPKGFDEVLINTIENLGLEYQVCSAFVYPEEGKQVITHLKERCYDFGFKASEDNYKSMSSALSSSLPELANLHWVTPPRQSGNGPAVKFTLVDSDRRMFIKKSCSVLLAFTGRGEVDGSYS